MRFVIHSLVILSAFIVAGLWEMSSFSSEPTLGIGLFILLYFIAGFFREKKRVERLPVSSGLDAESLQVFCLCTLVLILIASTGGFDSNLFFLLYFFPFVIVFYLVPESIIVFTVLVVGLNLPVRAGVSTMEELIQLGSLVLVSPLAYFFGKAVHSRSDQEQRLLQIEGKSEEVSEKVLDDVNALAAANHERLTDREAAILADIVAQTEALQKEITP